MNMDETFRTISNVQRQPSMLSVLEPISERQLRRLVSRGSSPSGEAVQSWGRREVAAWLAEIGMKQYQVEP